MAHEKVAVHDRVQIKQVSVTYSDEVGDETKLRFDVSQIQEMARVFGLELVDLTALSKLQDSYMRQGDINYELMADGVGRALSLIRTQAERGFGPNPCDEIVVRCQHPWHRNAGLITPCPECGEGSDDG